MNLCYNAIIGILSLGVDGINDRAYKQLKPSERFI